VTLLAHALRSALIKAVPDPVLQPVPLLPQPWLRVAPYPVLQAVTRLAQSLRGSREAVLWCKESAATAVDRVAALMPALQELERAVLMPGQGLEVRLVESISLTLVMLAKVGQHQGCRCAL
jgi:hypothetical protein